MKNKITILMALLFVLSTTQSFAQTTIDFEPAGAGAGYAWTVAENATNPAMNFIANPDMMINTSATVAEFTAEATGNPWALCFTDDIGSFTFDATNAIVKIMVWKPVISNVGIKFEIPNGAFHEILVPNTVTNQWEELTFDFSSQIGNSFSRVVIIPDFLARTQTNTVYLDELSFSAGGGMGVADSVDITFSVNAASVTTSTEGLFLAGGGVFGDPGDNPMMDNGSDVWTITKRMPKGMTFDYTFTNGFSGSWGDKENIENQPCAVAPYNDRRLMGAYADTTLLTCFGECISDGTCPAVNPPATTVDVTFQVDMSAETVDAGGVTLGGNFEGWSGSLPLTDADADGIWEVTVAIAENDSIEWKFLNGGWSNAEEFDTTNFTDCTLTTFGDNGDIFTNRFAVLGMSDTTLSAFVFNSCDISSSTKAVFTKDALFEIAPTLVSDYTLINFKNEVASADKQLQVVNAVGQVVMNETIGQAQQYRLDASQLSNGLYFVVIQADGFAQTARILVSK